MKTLLFLILVLGVNAPGLVLAQVIAPETKQQLSALINQYSFARENRDTTLLRKILTSDIDQLVSTGEWRNGIGTAVAGMVRSSAATPGTRTLAIDRMRLLEANSAIVDCRYEIRNDDGTMRKMWSTFVMVLSKGTWRIAAIRNMLPSAQ